MTSVNELNAHNRGYREGYHKGFEEGARSEKTSKEPLKLMKYAIAFTIGFMAAVAFAAEAQTATTSVQVIIRQEVTAEVACNPDNCPETYQEEPAIIESVEPEGSWWTRVVQWMQKLIT